MVHDTEIEYQTDIIVENDFINIVNIGTKLKPLGVCMPANLSGYSSMRTKNWRSYVSVSDMLQQ